MMRWIKGVIGVVLALIGLIWIGQGTMVLPGSAMSGHSVWAIIGVVLVVVAAWLLWSALRPGSSAKAKSR